jgi:hypothetical protein
VTQNALIVTSISNDMNTIPIEEARLIAERLLEQALARMDIANAIRSDRLYEVCEVIGLNLKC